MLFFLRRHGRVAEKDVHRYVEKRLLARGASMHRSSFVLPPSYRMERLTSGTNRYVYKLTSPDGEALVLRLLKNSEMTELHFGFNRYLAEQGFPVPEIVYEDRTRDTLRDFGCAVSIERFIEGDHFEGKHRSDPATINALAGLMARFHAVTSETAGLPWRPETLPWFDVLMGRVRHFHEKALRAGLIDKGETRTHQEWFGRWREALVTLRPYNLVHGDLNWTNVIVRQGGGIDVLDFIGTHLGYFELDLAESTRSLFCEDAESSRLFFQSYFELAGAAMRERYERNKPFFLAYVNLEKASSNAVKAVKVTQGRRLGYKPFEEKSRRHLAALRAMINDDGS